MRYRVFARQQCVGSSWYPYGPGRLPRGGPHQAATASAAEASLLHQRRLLRLLNRLTISDRLRRRGVFGAHIWGRRISFPLAVLDIIDVGVAQQSELCEGRGVARRLSRYPP